MDATRFYCGRYTDLQGALFPSMKKLREDAKTNFNIALELDNSMNKFIHKFLKTNSSEGFVTNRSAFSQFENIHALLLKFESLLRSKTRKLRTVKVKLEVSEFF